MWVWVGIVPWPGPWLVPHDFSRILKGLWRCAGVALWQEACTRRPCLTATHGWDQIYFYRVVLLIWCVWSMLVVKLHLGGLNPPTPPSFERARSQHELLNPSSRHVVISSHPSDACSRFLFPICVVIFVSKFVSQGAGRYLKSFLEAVAPS